MKAFIVFALLALTVSALNPVIIVSSLFTALGLTVDNALLCLDAILTTAVGQIYQLIQGLLNLSLIDILDAVLALLPQLIEDIATGCLPVVTDLLTFLTPFPKIQITGLLGDFRDCHNGLLIQLGELLYDLLTGVDQLIGTTLAAILRLLIGGVGEGYIPPITGHVYTTHHNEAHNFIAPGTVQYQTVTPVETINGTILLSPGKAIAEGMIHDSSIEQLSNALGYGMDVNDVHFGGHCVREIHRIFDVVGDLLNSLSALLSGDLDCFLDALENAVLSVLESIRGCHGNNRHHWVMLKPILRKACDDPVRYIVKVLGRRFFEGPDFRHAFHRGLTDLVREQFLVAGEGFNHDQPIDVKQ